jgi:hypothetical protein
MEIKITPAGICLSLLKGIAYGRAPKVIYFTKSVLNLNIQLF